MGASVGLFVVKADFVVGAGVGFRVQRSRNGLVGLKVGFTFVGETVGSSVVVETVGSNVGSVVVGKYVGSSVVGATVGSSVVGATDGFAVGEVVDDSNCTGMLTKRSGACKRSAHIGPRQHEGNSQ